MSETTIGTCGNCGGPVVRMNEYWGVGPFPPPACRSCGAVAKNSYGPVIPMGPSATDRFREALAKAQSDPSPGFKEFHERLDSLKRVSSDDLHRRLD